MKCGFEKHSDHCNLKNLDMSYQYLLLRQPINNVNFELAVNNDNDQIDLYDRIWKHAHLWLDGWPCTTNSTGQL